MAPQRYRPPHDFGVGGVAIGNEFQFATDEQAEATLARVGPNTLGKSKQASDGRLLARQFLSPIIIILVIATVLAMVLGDLVDSIIILVIILLSGLLGFWQERGAGRAIAALLATVEIKAEVYRDGAIQSVPISAVVPGDVAQLAAGDLVPGDSIVLSSNGLQLDESALTGETFPVEKVPGTVHVERDIGCGLDRVLVRPG